MGEIIRVALFSVGIVAVTLFTVKTAIELFTTEEQEFEVDEDGTSM